MWAWAPGWQGGPFHVSVTCTALCHLAASSPSTAQPSESVSQPVSQSVCPETL